MRILELFSGYGTASFALKNLRIKAEIIGYSDIDKYANQCFWQNHWKEILPLRYGRDLGDATKINPYELEDFDLLTGGFPCQAFSVAGKMLGELDTRGTLFHEIIRVAEVKKPKYMLLENVKGLTSKKHINTFNKIINELHRIGYFVKTRILNTKDYGIPQNRERVWFACFRNKKEWENFNFPEKEELKLFLKDILEEEVDEKYYLSESQMNRLIERTGVKVDSLEPEVFDVYNKKIKKDGVCITLTEPHHNNLRLIEPKKFLAIKNATKKGYLEGYPGDGVNLEHPNSKTRRGRIQKNVMGCLQTNDQRGVITEDYRIRKLTPRECFRLQGFLNDEVDLEGLSDTQRYKLAGNGQSVNVVSKIFEKMFGSSQLNSKENSND